jgi:hypothetical protein
MSNTFNKSYLMKHNVNDKVPNQTLNIQILSNGVSKLSGRLEGGHVTHF